MVKKEGSWQIAKISVEKTADIIIMVILGLGRALAMKKDIHPEYQRVVVHCGCGNTFETCSTAK